MNIDLEKIIESNSSQDILERMSNKNIYLKSTLKKFYYHLLDNPNRGKLIEDIIDDFIKNRL